MTQHNYFGGPISIVRIDPLTGKHYVSQTKPRNAELYSSADILAKLIAGQSQYKIGAVYFEFTNAVGGWSTPSFGASAADGYAYYNALTGTSDYIRVPVSVTPAITTSDNTKYVGNVASFFAQITAVIGQHGVSFANPTSYIVGAALVATPTTSASDDLVYARFYYGTPEQKLANMQNGLIWPVTYV